MKLIALFALLGQLSAPLAVVCPAFGVPYVLLLLVFALWNETRLLLPLFVFWLPLALLTPRHS